MHRFVAIAIDVAFAAASTWMFSTQYQIRRFERMINIGESRPPILTARSLKTQADIFALSSWGSRST